MLRCCWIASLAILASLLVRASDARAQQIPDETYSTSSPGHVVYDRPRSLDWGPLRYQQAGHVRPPLEPPAFQYAAEPLDPYHDDRIDYVGQSAYDPDREEGPLVRFLDSIEVYGWLSQGFTWNPDSPADRFNGPTGFNDRSNEYQLNQFYAVMERPISGDGSAWELGGRVDLLYGTDYFFTTALGLETHRDGSPRWNRENGPRGGDAALYGLAMPQLYAEVMIPIGTGLDVKLGHFYSIVGYESVMDPVNFFYSRSYAKQYAEPITETGLLSDYWLTEQWSIQAGVTRGWNTWEDINRDVGFLGGLTWSCPDGTSSVRFAISTGDEDPAGRNNRTVYSLVYRRELTPRLSYIFQNDFGTESDAAVTSSGTPTSAKWYDISQYLMYAVNDTTAWGLRFEWFRDRNNARVLGIPFDALTEGANYYELTAGLNWQPRARVLLRSELRWDWSDVSAPALRIGGMYDDFQDKDQFTWATNLVLSF